MPTATSYTLTASTSASFADAVERVRAEPELGTLRPCNVVVYERDGETNISAIDAERMLSIVDRQELRPIAAQARETLAAVVERASVN